MSQKRLLLFIGLHCSADSVYTLDCRERDSAADLTEFGACGIGYHADMLGYGLSILVDILNPEVIALGGVFMRNADLFMPIVDPILDREALSLARKVCRIVPAELGENIGDYAALAVAQMSDGK